MSISASDERPLAGNALMEGKPMADRQPVETTNLDRYGNAEIPWSRPHDLLAAPPPDWYPCFLCTVRPDGRPHAAGIGTHWHDGDLYIVSGSGTRKSRNLAENPACTLAISLKGLDLVLEGTATRVTDRETLETMAGVYRQGGWPAEVEGEAFTAPYSAPSAGPPPWDLYRFTFHTAFGVAGAEPHGATRWRFDR
jgi:hypothetical protein